MVKRLTNDEFIKRARNTHGDKYDYSKVEYINAQTKVCIICPVHGEFWQKPSLHLQHKGCMRCFLDKKKCLVCGKGINDGDNDSSICGKHTKSYAIWKAMIYRCYDHSYHKRYPTYKGCSVCEEWLHYSNFKKWFDEHYRTGYHLDKDILCQGNKEYAPSVCAFVPPRINTILGDSAAKRGKYKQGVCWIEGRNKFVATTKINKRSTILGYFDDEDSAFEAYKKAKYAEIKRVAREAFNNNEINAEVYLALLNFTIKE